ncbi:MAG TPA: hypothetical protein VLB68_07340 [Pyrinomonadaceae bacterium]|nr:hypothetical protein [Pyrinomonadaceae bacterium]
MPQPGREWSFRNAYAGALNLGDRIDKFEVLDAAQEILPVRKITAGEYRTDQRAQRIRYTINASSRAASEVAHITWLSEDYGCLLLADLLPTLFDGLELRIELKLPPQWSAQFSGSTDDNGRAIVKKPEEAVFVVGPNLKKLSPPINGQRLNLALIGKWKVSDETIMESAQRVFAHYLKLTEHKLSEEPLLIVAPYRFSGGNGWRAQTRGANVVLAMDPSASFRNWKGQLSVIFTHEFLHLWVPNSLGLKGDYDWFFEGFTLYEALITALQLKLINFQEYLDTLARVYDSYLSYPSDLSLIEASERRWTSSFPVVYDKGMLVALQYDLLVRAESEGQSSLSDLYPRLLNLAQTQANDANTAIIGLLDSSVSDSEFSSRYVQKKGSLDLTSSLRQYGIIVDSLGKRTTVKIDRNLNKKQKIVLRSLGYKQ